MTVSLDTPELAALPPSKAEQVRAVFLPMADMLQGFEDEYNSVMAEAAEEVTPEVSKRARRLRLDIAKVRIDAEKARVAIKAEYLLATKAIDGTNNILKWAVSEKEQALEAIEKHAERMEAERMERLQAERAEALAPYVEDAADRNLSGMDEDVWTAYLAAKKKEHEDRLAAEAAAEAERRERERIAALTVERERKIAPVFDFFEGPYDPAEVSDDDFAAALASAAEKKAAHAAEQERVRKERERLEKEAAENEKARQAELAKIEAERQKERERLEKERRAELARIETERAKERAAAEAERTRLAALEAAEADRKAKEAEDAKARAAAEREAAKAPVRKRLTAWVDSFALPDLPGEEHEVAARVRDKFAAFQKWAKAEIEGGV